MAKEFDPTKEPPRTKPVIGEQQGNTLGATNRKDAKDVGIIDEAYEKFINPAVKDVVKTWEGMVHNFQTIRANIINGAEKIQKVFPTQSSNEHDTSNKPTNYANVTMDDVKPPSRLPPESDNLAMNKKIII